MSDGLLPPPRRLCFQCHLCACQQPCGKTTSPFFMNTGGGVEHEIVN